MGTSIQQEMNYTSESRIEELSPVEDGEASTNDDWWKECFDANLADN